MEGARALAQERAAGGEVGRRRMVTLRGSSRHPAPPCPERAADESTPGTPAPGCVPAPTRKSPSTSSLRLWGRNQALWVSTGSSPNAAPRKESRRSWKSCGRHQARGDHCLLQARQQRALQMRRDPAPVGLGHGLPVGAAFQMRHRRQHVERIAARRCQRGIARRRPVQIEAEVVRQMLALEDVGQQLPIPRPQDDRVVADVRILPPRAEIPDEEAHRVAGTARSAGRSSGAVPGPAAACGRSRPSRRSRPRCRRRPSRPPASRTPVARRPSSAIASTSAPQRTSPPWPSIRPPAPAPAAPSRPRRNARPSGARGRRSGSRSRSW